MGAFPHTEAQRRGVRLQCKTKPASNMKMKSSPALAPGVNDPNYERQYKYES
jgi:hypothetical protein